MPGVDFDGDTPFVAGKIRGMRSFRIPSEGDRVTGCTYSDQNWNPDVNEAIHAGTSPELVMGPLGPTAHRIAGRGCHCGYYGFTDGKDDYSFHNSSVTGIIEGYGTVTIGTRGFRASKAKIVAFIDDKKPPEPALAPPERSRWDRVSMNLGRLREWVLKAVWVSLVAGLFTASALDDQAAKVAAVLWAVVGLAFIATTLLAKRHAAQLALDDALRMLKSAGLVFKVLRSPHLDTLLEQEGWRDIPVFKTKEEALAAYPLGMVGPDA